MATAATPSHASTRRNGLPNDAAGNVPVAVTETEDSGEHADDSDGVEAAAAGAAH